MGLGKSGLYNAGKWKTLEEHLSGSVPGRIVIPVNKSSPPRTPEGVYAHEAAHALVESSGGAKWLLDRFNLPFTNESIDLINPFRRPVVEGHAEGMGNAILGRFNKEAYAPYFRLSWPESHKLFPEYNKGGELGVEMGNALREGKLVDQKSAVEEVLNLIINSINKHGL